jgi:hypothetical protein
MNYKKNVGIGDWPTGLVYGRFAEIIWVRRLKKSTFYECYSSVQIVYVSHTFL